MPVFEIYIAKFLALLYRQWSRVRSYHWVCHVYYLVNFESNHRGGECHH